MENNSLNKTASVDGFLPIKSGISYASIGSVLGGIGTLAVVRNIKIDAANEKFSGIGKIAHSILREPLSQVQRSEVLKSATVEFRELTQAPSNLASKAGLVITGAFIAGTAAGLIGFVRGREATKTGSGHVARLQESKAQEHARHI